MQKSKRLMWVLFAITTSVTLTLAISSVAQPGSDYVPGAVHSAMSSKLIFAIRRQGSFEMNRNGLDNGTTLGQLYKHRTEYLEALVRDSFFINNPRIDQLLTHTLHRIQSTNELTKNNKILLGARSPFPNAACAGEGTFYFTTDLLARIQNQSQLAAVIGHELGHYELNHFRDLMEAADRSEKISRRSIRSADDIIIWRNELFKLNRYSRVMEYEADSVALVYIRNAGFREPEMLSMLSLMDPGDTSSIEAQAGGDLFDPIRFSKYPFQKAWLAGRPSVYSKQMSDYFGPVDSMSTHPELKHRMARLAPRIKQQGEINYVSDSLLEASRWSAQIESVEAAFKGRRMDAALYEALIGLKKDPGNTYLVSTIARIFLILCELDDNMMKYYLPPGTAGYNVRMRKTNDFLHHLTRKEMAELGFNFINLSTNFNENVEVHYYLLSKFCDLTSRNTVKSKVVTAYLAKFPKGKYKRELR